ncbi:MAG: hypothetical protein DRJ10_00125 [Bacteroidetes bacterium]|nr:MAG: hypothetical protein DRJ10_00080 [Bacteroidota bacterium]RLD84837.1 MAG: hypothetical protein DRJ10_00125 [Bacteroidota bacterium]
MLKKALYLLLINFVFVAFNVEGQSLKYYQKQKNRNKESIQYSKQLLSELQKTNKNKLDQLYLIRNELNKRKSTILVINREIELISQRISRDNEKLQKLYFELENQKNEYAKLIYYSSLNLSVQDRMIYLLSASSFNNAYKRTIYLKQLTDYRKSKYKMISYSIKSIDSSITAMSLLKFEKGKLYLEKKDERDSLLNLKRKLDHNISKLKLKMSEIDFSERNKKEKNRILNSNLTIEISKNISITKETENKKEKKIGKVTGTDFAKYRKQLLWPLKKFVLLHKFGNYAHPVLNDITLRNDGVELGASPNSNVYSVYWGLVVNVISIPGMGHSIIIKHGDYYSVYSQVGKVYIEKGQNVSRGQRIAQLKNDTKLEKLIFQIWKGKKKLDPQKWLVNV